MTDEATNPELRPARGSDEPRKRSRAVGVVAALMAALILVGGLGTAFAFEGPSESAPAPSPTREHIQTPTPTPTPTPTIPATAPLARAAMFRGSVDAWQIPANAEIAATLPAAGSAHSGSVSLAIDAPALRQPMDAAAVSVAVEPGVTYTASVWVRLQAVELTSVPATFVVGDVFVPVPELNAEWQEIETEVTVPADVTSLNVTLLINAPVTGLMWDDVSLQAEEGQNLVPNPSFESVQAGATIANDSLVMSTATATIAAAIPEGLAAWQLLDSAGSVRASGNVTGAGPMTPIPLQGATQGHHTLVLTDVSGAATETPIALVDTSGASVPRDPRFGVTAQFDRAWHAGSGRLSAALGFGELHADFWWQWNQSNFGEFAFDDRYLSQVPEVRANGLGLVGVIAYGNKLFDRGRAPSSPQAIEAFGRYAAEVARTFDLTALEVFNEFNETRFNKGDCGTDPRCYVPLLESVKRHLGEGGLSTKIIAGATALYDQEWFTGLWQAGGMAYVDIVSYHPYEGWINRNPDLMRPTVAQSIADMQQHAGATRPIWITEMGFTSMIGGVTLEQQRDWLIRSEALAFAGGVEKYMWYDIVDDSADPANGEGNFGLYEHAPRAGVAVVAPKPAAYAQALLVSQLNGRAVGGDESDAASNVIRFGEANDAVRVAWAVGDSSEWALASTTAVQVVTSDGTTTSIEPVAGQVVVPLSAQPSFISTPAAESDTEARLTAQ